MRPYPGPNPAIPISGEGGIDPAWSPDGRQIYYMEGQFTFSLTSANPELITRENAPWFLRPVIDQLGTAIASPPATRHPSRVIG